MRARERERDQRPTTRQGERASGHSMKPRTGRESGVETEQSDRQGEQKQRCNQEYRQSKATGRVKKREVHTDMRTERERECACVCMRERERERRNRRPDVEGAQE